MIPAIRHSGKGKTMETVKRPMVAGVWELGEEDRIGEAQGIFRAVQLLCMILWWWINDIMHLSKLQGELSQDGGVGGRGVHLLPQGHEEYVDRWKFSQSTC